MNDTIEISAPCKINAHLQVFHKRADGYHDIESVFQLISLADELSVSIAGGTASCQVVSPKMVLPPVNTITRSVDQFRSVTGIKNGITVHIAKNVPAGGGLGGGSSDAAAVLRALDRLFDTRLDPSVMTGMAAGIGSDVPFFLSGPAAIVEGRGEKISPIAPRSDLFGVLIWPDVHSSTAEAYALVDRWFEQDKAASGNYPKRSELEAMYAGPSSSWLFGNSFSLPLETAFPVIGAAKADLRSSGASFVEMSGSGSSVFGLYEDEKDADTAQKMLSSRWRQCVKFLLLAS